VASLVNYRPYHEVLDRVEDVRARLRSTRIAEGLLAFAAVAALVVLSATLMQGYLRFGSWGRLVLLVVGLTVLLAALWRLAVAPFRWDPNDKEIARLLELRLPQLGNSLINTILLAEQSTEWSSPLVERAIGEAAAGARGVDLLRAISHRRAKRWAIGATVAVLALAAFAAAQSGRFASAGLQILMPFSHIASVGDVRLLAVAPGNAEWMKGEPLDIVVTIDDQTGRRLDGFVEITEAAGPVRKPLVRDPDHPDRFTFHVPQVIQPMVYWVGVGGTESQRYAISLHEQPLVGSIDIYYTLPDYTGPVRETVEGASGEIRCLVGTTVKMRVHVTAKVTGGSLSFGSGDVRRCLVEDDGKTLSASFAVLHDDTYLIHLEDQAPDGASVTYPITALPDEPPTIQFTLPGRDVYAVPGGTVRLALKAADRYGLAKVRLMARLLPKADEKSQAFVVKPWEKFADPKDASLDFAFVLDPARYKLGQTVEYWAEATDRRTYQGGNTPQGPNLSTTPPLKIIVEDRKAAGAKQLEQLTRLFERLREILKSQQDARASADALKGATRLPDVRAAATPLGAAQKSIREATLAVTHEVVFDGQTMPIKVTLEALAANEMASALAKAQALATVADLAGAKPATADLARDQDAVIAVLKRILDITDKLASAVKENQQRLDPSDLPPDELAKLKTLHDRLKQFVDEQKKVIEASKDLSKKPVDDFTETDQKNLDALKAKEDQWDKFLAEAIADFSKIPDVDASNPSLVKELIEVKTDVEMAADALSKKAMDVVVPLEELGMEGAKEIVENLERWLPDTPDRARWSQEEFTGDVEIPHAELPQQMEDLVGNLLEQEEDLFAEMDDKTSGAADSADKGAGWDAMDGPISNYSAKGVTGNQLPNSSEISGRSGEGRSGKASGEFVEDEATGKGGRRTPTRLTPEPYSKGEIKDSSPESPGGATGGGKISGAGNEGLEGPVPPEVQRRMGSLAGKQAQLRNKAEGVKAALKVKNYDSFSIDQALDAMRRVERDLLAGRYSSALRQKDIVVDKLQDTRMMVGGEVRIRQDASPAVPNEVRQDVLDALDKPMPRGYEEYLKKYYERLSEGK
jgi:hypothetical protein